MAPIRSIRLGIATGDIPREDGEGTNGDLYLGIAGREFYIDKAGEDFEPRKPRTYVFGEGANVLEAEYNDPRHPPLDTEVALSNPVYLRFAPKGRDDNWLLDDAQVALNGEFFPRWNVDQIHPDSEEKIWLGIRRGLIVQLFPDPPGAVASNPTVNVSVQMPGKS